MSGYENAGCKPDPLKRESWIKKTKRDEEATVATKGGWSIMLKMKNGKEPDVEIF